MGLSLGCRFVASSSFWARDVFDLDSEAWKSWSGSFDKEKLSLAMWWSLGVKQKSDSEGPGGEVGLLAGCMKVA